MSHYAKVVNGIVKNLIVADTDFMENFIDDSPGRWIQTSYNTYGGKHYDKDRKEDGGVALRKNYAGVGFIYNEELDAFYPPQPFTSWILNEDTCQWEAPVVRPDDDKFYNWNEDKQSWDEIKYT
jgi:hypothetical protein